MRSALARSLRSLVVRLLFVGCPLAIRLRVAAIIFLAFKRHSRRWRWLLAHVGEEIVEFHPSFAYRDASPAVVVKARMVWIGAALDHRLPTGVGSRWIIFRRVSVPQLSWKVAQQASAACRSTGTKMIALRNDLIAAFAATLPSNMLVAAIDATFNRQASELLTCQINQVHRRAFR